MNTIITDKVLQDMPELKDIFHALSKTMNKDGASIEIENELKMVNLSKY